MKKQEFSNQVQTIATEARNKLIDLIADVCRQQGGEIKFKYYNCSVIDEEDGETLETNICGAYLDDDDDLFFIIEKGADEEDAVMYSFNELYNICLAIEKTMNGKSNMERGSWHGNDATILERDDDGVTILIGSYTENEVKAIYQLYLQEDPEIEDYEVEYVENDEWKEQNF